MFGADERIAELLGAGGSLGLILVVALLLGLRHATDPDHLAAVTTLIATDPRDGRRRALRLGTAWGLGHGTTLVLLGLPVVLFRSYLPEHVRQLAELLVGLMIIGLGARLLLRREARHGATRHRQEAYAI